MAAVLQVPRCLQRTAPQRAAQPPRGTRSLGCVQLMNAPLRLMMERTDRACLLLSQQLQQQQPTVPALPVHKRKHTGIASASAAACVHHPSAAERVLSSLPPPPLPARLSLCLSHLLQQHHPQRPDSPQSATDTPIPLLTPPCAADHHIAVDRRTKAAHVNTHTHTGSACCMAHTSRHLLLQQSCKLPLRAACLPACVSRCVHHQWWLCRTRWNIGQPPYGSNLGLARLSTGSKPLSTGFQSWWSWFRA